MRPYVAPYAPSLVDWQRGVSKAINYKIDVNTLSAAPAKGNWNSIDTAFTGDNGAVYLTTGRYLTGNVLGTPATGYQHNPETASINGYVYSSSGNNQSTSIPDGRTNGHWAYIKVDNYGQGDLTAITVEGIVVGAKPGATSWLANPGVCVLNGTLVAGSHAVYCNPYEVRIDLRTYDAAGVGYVSNITRNAGDTVNGLGAYTSGFRAQSDGSYAVDSAFSASGLHKVGLDLTPINLDTNKAGAALQGGHRIYLNAISSDGFKATGYGSDYIVRTGLGVETIYGGTLALRVASSGLTIPEFAVASVPSPAAGFQTLFIDTADHKLKRKDSAGTVTIIA